jgi:hypothetical protein
MMAASGTVAEQILAQWPLAVAHRLSPLKDFVNFRHEGILAL